MAALLDQLPDDAGDRFTAQSPTVERRVEEQVDCRVPILRLGLLPVLDQAGDPTVKLERVARRLRFVPGEVLRRVIPPATHLGGQMDAAEFRRIAGDERSKKQMRVVIARGRGGSQATGAVRGIIGLKRDNAHIFAPSSWTWAPSNRAT